jgi:DME family drug/metabolite transporter
VFILATALLFSTGGTAIKLASLSNWQIACFRSGLAAVVLLLFLPGCWRWWWRPSSLIVGTAFGTTFILFVTANTLTTAANAIFLQYTAPLYVLLLGPLLLGEKNRWSDVLVIAVIVVGMLLFFVGQPIPSPTAPDPLLGNLIALGCGAMWSLCILGLRWLGQKSDSAVAGGAAIIAGNMVAFLICLPWAFPVANASLTDWGVVTYLGTIQIALAYWFLLRGISQVRALEVSVILAFEPVMSGALAWMVHGELPGLFAGAGCALIFLGVIVKLVRND